MVSPYHWRYVQLPVLLLAPPIIEETPTAESKMLLKIQQNYLFVNNLHHNMINIFMIPLMYSNCKNNLKKYCYTNLTLHNC